jgi:hypothetical protein
MAAIDSDHETTEQPVNRPPGVCVPWEQKRNELAAVNGDPELFERIWGEVDQLPYLYIWYCLLAF